MSEHRRVHIPEIYHIIYSYLVLLLKSALDLHMLALYG